LAPYARGNLVENFSILIAALLASVASGQVVVTRRRGSAEPIDALGVASTYLGGELDYFVGFRRPIDRQGLEPLDARLEHGKRITWGVTFFDAFATDTPRHDAAQTADH
jgi:hypothetical protein